MLFRFGDNLLDKKKIKRFQKQKVIVKEESCSPSIVEWHIYAVLDESHYDPYRGQMDIKLTEIHFSEAECEERMSQLMEDF